MLKVALAYVLPLNEQTPAAVMPVPLVGPGVVELKRDSGELQMPGPAVAGMPDAGAENVHGPDTLHPLGTAEVHVMEGSASTGLADVEPMTGHAISVGSMMRNE